jgi:hypothetical protein
MIPELAAAPLVVRRLKHGACRARALPLAFRVCAAAFVLAACAGGQSTSPGTNPPGETPTGPTVDGNAYFDALAARPDFWKGLSLRPIAGRADMTDPYYENQLLQPQFGGFANAGSRELSVTYAPDTDEDPRRQDAAKVVIPAFNTRNPPSIFLDSGCSSADTVLKLSRQFSGSELFSGRAVLVDSEAMLISGTNLAAHTATVRRGYAGTRAQAHSAAAAVIINSNSLANQVRFPIGSEDGHTYLFTWDVYWTDSYVRSGLTNHKAFQLASGGTLWLEAQANYAGGEQTLRPQDFNREQDVAAVQFRSYNVLGGGVDWRATDGNHLGPGVVDNEPLRPNVGTFTVRPNRWVRYWVQIAQRQDDYDLLDVWVADEISGPIQIYRQLPVTLPRGRTISDWWIEFNTSTDLFVRGDLRDFVAYVRNFAILRDAAASPVSLMQRPIP